MSTSVCVNIVEISHATIKGGKYPTLVRSVIWKPSGYRQIHLTHYLGRVELTIYNLVQKS